MNIKIRSSVGALPIPSSIQPCASVANIVWVMHDQLLCAHNGGARVNKWAYTTLGQAAHITYVHFNVISRTLCMLWYCIVHDRQLWNDRNAQLQHPGIHGMHAALHPETGRCFGEPLCQQTGLVFPPLHVCNYWICIYLLYSKSTMHRSASQFRPMYSSKDSVVLT